MKNRTSNLFLLLVALFFLPFYGCSDDKDGSGFVEYTNPMNDNPVNSLSWLGEERKKIIESMHSERTYFDEIYPILSYPVTSNIQWYQHEGKDYFLILNGTIKVDVNYLFLYDSSGERLLGVGSEPSYPQNDKKLEEFMENATHKALLWEYKYVK